MKKREKNIMSFRFLVGADWHIRSTQPLMRKDDFLSAQKRKMIFVFQQSEYLKCPIIINGDLFDVHNPCLSIISEFIRFRKLTSQKVYVNLGNHDLAECNLASLRNTAVGLLLSSGVVNCGEDINLETREVEFVFRPYLPYFNPEVRLNPKKHDKPLVIVTHANISPTSGLPFEHFPVDTLTSTADLVLCSHYHKKFVMKKDNTIYYNPGTLTRQVILEQTKGVTPKLSLIEISSLGKIDISCFDIPCDSYAMIADEEYELKSSLKRLRSDDDVNVEQFLSTVSHSTLENVDILQLVDKIGTEFKFSKEVIQRVITTLKKKQSSWEI